MTTYHNVVLLMFWMFSPPRAFNANIIVDQCCAHLALRRLLALSSQCSDTVSSSCRRAMAFSTDG